MQRFFVDVLRSQGVIAPLIVDVGIGLGAPTLLDLARELKRSGFETATVLGIDASTEMLTWTNLIFQRMRDQIGLPPGIRLVLEHGDVCHPSESAFSLRSIVERLFGAGTRADLCLSSNLLRGPSRRPPPEAIASMRNCISKSGFIGLGAGNATDLLTVDVFRQPSDQSLASFNITYGEPDTEHARRLAVLRELTSSQQVR